MNLRGWMATTRTLALGSFSKKKCPRIYVTWKDGGLYAFGIINTWLAVRRRNGPILRGGELSNAGDLVTRTATLLNATHGMLEGT